MAGLESASLTIGNRGVWCARLDSNQHCTAFEAGASAPWDYGRMVGSGGFEPTLDTVWGGFLCRGGLRACGVRGETRTRNNAVLDRTRLPNCATRTLVGSQGFEPWRFQWNTGATARSFRPLSQLPKRIVKDLAEGRRLERLCPEGPGFTNGLSRPVGYQLPEPSGCKLEIELKGNYRLDERHQD